MALDFLITGAEGQLAKSFIAELSRRGHSYEAYSKKQLNLTQYEKVLSCIQANQPKVILNCAAYNNVDKAEKEERELAFLVNEMGAQHLLKATQKTKSLLVHYSTDFVFSGEKMDFYLESDSPNPKTYYGQSKFQGEQAFGELLDQHLIFRTSWVMGLGKSCFLTTLERLAQNKKTLKMTTDYLSIPTYAKDIATITLLALKQGLRGLFHLTSQDYASKYEQARYYFHQRGFDQLILPVTSEDFPCPAKRPYFTALSNKKLSSALNYPFPHWKDAIQRLIFDHRDILT